MTFFTRYQAGFHLLGWAVFLGLPFLTLPDFLFNAQDLLSIGIAQLLTGGLTITFFYVNLQSLMPGLLHRQQVARFWVAMLLMLTAVVLARWLAFDVWPPAVFAEKFPKPDLGGHPGGGHRRAPTGFWRWRSMFGAGISFGFAMLVSTLIALFRDNIRSQEARQQMMLEKVSAELAVLKLQISPHFLFNTLNNIRWLARQKSEQTEAAVVSLAQLLRYMIYQARQDRVPLRQEIQHLQDYIDLQTMRLTQQHTVTFVVEGDVDACQIEPLLFIPFVENAFKFGLHSQQPSQIDIRLAVTGHTLTFSTDNPTQPPAAPADTPGSDRAGTGEPASGIGLANVRQRLALHYPNRHELHLTTEAGIFHVRLTLDLDTL
jgi:Histidine kinase